MKGGSRKRSSVEIFNGVNAKRLRNVVSPTTFVAAARRCLITHFVYADIAQDIAVVHIHNIGNPIAAFVGNHLRTRSANPTMSHLSAAIETQ